MAAYHTALWEALVDLIGETWPEVVPNGIYRARELARIDWERKAKRGELPLCVVDVEYGPSTRAGVCNRTEVVTATIYRIVGAVDEPDCAAQMDKAQELQQALWPLNGTKPLYPSGQVEAYPLASDHLGLLLNRYFLQSAQPFWGTAVVVRILVGETR
jgi:hypothetical protein